MKTSKNSSIESANVVTNPATAAQAETPKKRRSRKSAPKADAPKATGNIQVTSVKKEKKEAVLSPAEVAMLNMGNLLGAGIASTLAEFGASKAEGDAIGKSLKGVTDALKEGKDASGKFRKLAKDINTFVLHHLENALDQCCSPLNRRLYLAGISIACGRDLMKVKDGVELAKIFTQPYKVEIKVADGTTVVEEVDNTCLWYDGTFHVPSMEKNEEGSKTTTEFFETDENGKTVKKVKVVDTTKLETLMPLEHFKKGLTYDEILACTYSAYCLHGHVSKKTLEEIKSQAKSADDFGLDDLIANGEKRVAQIILAKRKKEHADLKKQLASADERLSKATERNAKSLQEKRDKKAAELAEFEQQHGKILGLA